MIPQRRKMAAADQRHPRVRAVTLTGYDDVARLVGLDPYEMLARARIHPTALRGPENWLPADRVISLIDNSAALSKRDDFGVLLGECRTFATLGPISLLLRHEATVHAILSAIAEYRKLLNDILHVSVRDDGRNAIVEYNLFPGLQSSQTVNLVATIAHRAMADASVHMDSRSRPLPSRGSHAIGGVQTGIPLSDPVRERL
jgi:AraC-type transcriptional regulator